MSEDIDRTLFLALPLPLAQAWRRALYAETPLAIHDRALSTLEAATRYLASVATACWVARGAEGVAPRKACEALVRPSLGHWTAILRSCAQALPEGDPARKWLDGIRDTVLSSPGVEGLRSRTVEQFIDSVPAYRNALAHGSGLQASTAEERAPLLRDLTRELLCSLIGEGAPVLNGVAGGKCVRLIGFGVELAPGHSGHETGTVMIRLDGRDVVLSPMWIFDPDEHDVLILNKGAGLKTVEYLSYGASRGGTGISVRKGEAARRVARFLEIVTGNSELRTEDVAAFVEEAEVQELAARSSRMRIGPFRIVRQVAKGGQGILYEAIQEDPPRRVALKMLSLQSAVEETSRRRFREEAEALARVEHPGVVPLYSVGEHEGVPWIAMKFVVGRSLHEVIDSLRAQRGAVTLLDWNQAAMSASDRPVSEAKKTHCDRVAEIGRDVAEALAVCHERGVVHRDVKPGNVMLDVDGRVLLTDFGLARTTGARTRTLTRRFVGTLQYVAPEGLLPAGRKGPDARVDVYGLGATLYEALALRRPFQDHEADEGALLRAVQTKDPPRLRKAAPWAPKDLTTIVEKAMEKDRDRRYDSARALAEDLERFLRGQPIRARPAGPITRTRKWARRNPVKVAVASVLILAAASVVVGLFAKKRVVDARTKTYLASIASASAALERHDLETAREHLSQAPEEYRGWEWRHLETRLDESLAVLRGHQRAVVSLAVSVDGRRIASGSMDGDVRLWEGASGRPLRAGSGEPVLFRTGSPVDSITFSPDGARVAAGSYDKALRVWDLATRTRVAGPLEHPDQVTALAFGPDGRRLASGTAGPSIHLWDAVTFRADSVLPALHNKGRIRWLAFLDGGRRLASVCADRTLVIWDAAKKVGLAPHLLAGHDGAVNSVAIAPDAGLLASASEDGTIRTWSLEDGKPIGDPIRGHSGGVWSVAFSPGGKRLASGSSDRTVRVWDVVTREELALRRGHTGDVYAVAFTAGGTRVVSGSKDGTLRLWRPECVLRARAGCVNAVAFDPSGNTIATAHANGSVFLWDATTRRRIGALHAGTRAAHSVRFSPNGAWIATAHADGRVCLFSAKTKKTVHAFAPGAGPAHCLAFSPDSQCLASGSDDGTVRLWAMATRTEAAVLRGHRGAVRSLAVSPTGDVLASASDDGEVRLWDGRSGRPSGLLEGSGASLSSVAFSPDGTHIAVGGSDALVRLFEVDSGERLAILRGHDDPISAVAFSPDGTRIVSASHDATVRIWDPASEKTVLTLRGHPGPILALAFSPDGTRIASGSFDGTTRIRDTIPASRRCAAYRSREPGRSR